MVILHSEHPARLSAEFRKGLSRLSFGANYGYMWPYIINMYQDEWSLGDKVFWIEKKKKVIAWAVRTQAYPYCTPYFMVFVDKKHRREKWGTVLYKEAMRYCKKTYAVFGSHGRGAKSFYLKQGRKDYD